MSLTSMGEGEGEGEADDRSVLCQSARHSRCKWPTPPFDGCACGCHIIVDEAATSPHAFEFIAAFPKSRKPWSPDAEDGGTLTLEWSQPYYDIVSALYKAGRNRTIRIVAEVMD